MPRLKAKSNGPRLAAADSSRGPRPLIYSPEIGEAICSLISDGKFLHEVCLQKGMPDFITVYRWLDRHPEYARAREAGVDFIDHKMLENMRNCTPATASACLVRFRALQWRYEGLTQPLRQESSRVATTRSGRSTVGRRQKKR